MKIILLSSSTCPACPKAVRVGREVIPSYYSDGVTYKRYKVNKGEGKTVAANYYVMSVPTFLFLDNDGNELKRITGVPGHESLAKQIEIMLGLRKSFLSNVLSKFKKESS